VRKLSKIGNLQAHGFKYASGNAGGLGGLAGFGGLG
jgi:hypothetical protein